jgi:hypothetical protein
MFVAIRALFPFCMAFPVRYREIQDIVDVHHRHH